MQQQARVVVIGGGAVGCSALYHLAKLGWTDCVLLERDELTSGSTWHAAGNCPNFSTSWNVMKLQRYSTQLYARLAAQEAITYRVTGSIRLAHTRDRLDEFRQVTAMANAQGIGFAVLSPAEVRDRYPFIETHDLLGGLHDPFDGDIDPSQLTQAFARGARDAGARIHRFTRVTGLAHTASGWRVETSAGAIDAEVVVNAAGYRAGEVMALLGRRLPMVTMQHQYLVTEAIPALAGSGVRLPLLRDPDTSWYLRQERDGLLLGPYERQATPAWLDGIPDEFASQLYADDLDRLAPQLEDAIARVPILGSVGVQRVINGPIPYSPDGNPYIGPAPGLRGFFQCCAFSFGIAQAGGAGKALAEWVVLGGPEWELWPLDPRRYGDYATKTYTVARAVELYQHEYAIAYPREERPAGRPALTSPLYPLLRAKGAVFGARGGWERAAWFARDGALDIPSFRRDVPGFAAVGEECRAVRGRVGIMDLAGFTKLTVAGPGAAAWLDRLVCGRLPKPGRIALTWLLHAPGGIACEFTVTRLAEDRFYLVSAAAAEMHDLDTLERLLPADGSVGITNVSADLGTLVLAGPRAREVLAAVTGSELSNAAFPWLAAREIEAGFGRLLALRVGYVGELGWELHAKMAQLLPLYEALWQAGQAHGIADFGMVAMDSLRLEKCYRGWQGELTRETSPLAAGLGRLVDVSKPEFPGRDALLREHNSGPRETLVPLLLENAGDADAPACAPVWANGVRVGLTTSGGWGHTIGRSIALAYVRPDLARVGQALDVEILGERRAARVAREPLYDPTNARLRA